MTTDFYLCKVLLRAGDFFSFPLLPLSPLFSTVWCPCPVPPPSPLSIQFLWDLIPEPLLNNSNLHQATPSPPKLCLLFWTACCTFWCLGACKHRSTEPTFCHYLPPFFLHRIPPLPNSFSADFFLFRRISYLYPSPHLHQWPMKKSSLYYTTALYTCYCPFNTYLHTYVDTKGEKVEEVGR